MAGFVRNKIFRLVFEDEEFDGLEVRIKPMSTEAMIALARVEFSKDQEFTDEDEAAIRGKYSILEKYMIDWNVENEETDDDGNVVNVPVPPTVDGFLTQDFGFMVHIMNTWMTAVTDVGKAQQKPLTSGSQSAVESIPMETLSESRAS